MTSTREEQLEALRKQKPPPPDSPPQESTSDGLTALQSQVSALAASVQMLADSQNNATTALDALVKAADQTPEPAPPATVELPETVAALPRRLDAVQRSLTQLSEKIEKVETVQQEIGGPFGITLSAATRGALIAEMTTALGSKSTAAPISAQGRTQWMDGYTEEMRQAMVAHDKLSRSLRWAGWGQLALAVVPFAVVAVVLLALVIPIAEILGVGPLAAWAWASFEATDSTATRSWIALATLAAISGVGYGTYRAGLTLARRYKEMTR